LACNAHEPSPERAFRRGAATGRAGSGAHQPSWLLLADEPTGNLDSHTGTEIMNMVREFNQQLGMTVVMVTHERALAERYAQRLIFLADGKLISDEATQPSSPAGGTEQERR
jgi:ABC-type lipoprotein export system ATPase subunit